MNFAVVIPGVILILIAAPFRCKRFNLNVIQSILLILMALVLGYFGTKVLFNIENRDFTFAALFKLTGYSLYGAIFSTLLLFPLCGLIFKLKIQETLDIGAVLILPMMAVLRINCYVEGCCGSRMLFKANGDPYFIPLQLFEMAFVLILMVAIIILETRHLFKNYLFNLFLIFYGLYRFFIEFLRESNVLFLGLTNAQVYSLIVIIFSLILMGINFKKIIASNKEGIEEYKREQKLKKYRKSNI